MGSKRYQRKRDMETGLLILNQHKKIHEMSSVGNIKMSSACGCKGESSSSSSMKCQSLNTQEAQSLMFEVGSDVFTSNRHTLHNNEARSFNMMNFRTQRVTSLMLRSNTQWVKHAAALMVGGILVFN